MRSLTRRSVRARPTRHWLASKFAHGPDAAAAKVIDVVEHPFALAELDQILHRGDEVFLRQDALVLDRP